MIFFLKRENNSCDTKSIFTGGGNVYNSESVHHIERVSVYRSQSLSTKQIKEKINRISINPVNFIETL